MKEKWMSSENKFERKGEEKGVHEPDLIKEKEVKGIIKKGMGLKITGGKNLFLDLVERISYEFSKTNCWICGDTRTAEIWPWEGTALSPKEILKLMKNKMKIQRSTPGRDGWNGEEVWNLKSEVVGEECLWRKGSSKFISYMGELSCKRHLVSNDTHQWWIPRSPHLYCSKKQKLACSYIQREKLYDCPSRDPNPFHDEPQIYKFWNNNGITSVEHHKFWRAPKELFWLCGKVAYAMLAKDWAGSCTLGITRPSFF